MAFAYQVGGHASTIQASPLSAATLCKPSAPRERAFYEHLGPSLADGHFVGEWTPAFYGTLRLEGKVGEQGALEKLDTAGDEAGSVEPEMLVLENLTYRFLRPNVLDIKLGTQLFDEDASEEKKERMRKAAANSTSGETGIRLTGFQVWDSTSQSYVQTPKPFGRALTPSELPLGLARFFYPPLSSPSSAESSGAVDPPSTTPTPLPTDLLLPVLRTIERRLERLEEVWERLEVRMRGGSLLLVVEGDADALEAALLRAQAAQTAPSSANPAPSSSAEDDETASTSSASTSDSAGNPHPSTLLPLEVRLIDFAHTRGLIDDESGPDEGVLKGLRTVRGLVGGLRERLASGEGVE
ncbi:hypothetical protein JCM6882_000992 [Rhodosporidiobolus microsporus]